MGTETIKLPALPGEGMADLAADIVREVFKNENAPQYWKLPSPAETKAVMNAVLDRDVPCGEDVARECVTILTTAFPSLKPHDPEMYMTHLEKAFSEYGEHHAKAGMEWLVRNRKFLPAPADVYEACNLAKDEDRRIIGCAKAMERERERRKKEAERSERIKAEREAFRAKHGDKTPFEVFYGDRSPAKKMKAS